MSDKSGMSAADEPVARGWSLIAEMSSGEIVLT